MKTLNYFINRRNKPKRTIKQLHDLWIAAENRAKQRRDLVCEYILRIVNEIEPNENGEYTVYTTKNGKTYGYYIIKYDNIYKSHSYSYTTFDCNKDRKSKIIDILQGKEHEMGQKFNELLNSNRYFNGIVFRKLLQEIIDHLRKTYSQQDNKEKEIISIQIDNHSYLLEATVIHRNIFTDFKWIGKNEIKNFDLNYI